MSAPEEGVPVFSAVDAAFCRLMPETVDRLVDNLARLGQHSAPEVIARVSQIVTLGEDLAQRIERAIMRQPVGLTASGAKSGAECSSEIVNARTPADRVLAERVARLGELASVAFPDKGVLLLVVSSDHEHHPQVSFSNLGKGCLLGALRNFLPLVEQGKV